MGWVTLGKFLNLSELQTPHLKDGPKSSAFLLELVRELYEKLLAWAWNVENAQQVSYYCYSYLCYYLSSITVQPALTQSTHLSICPSIHKIHAVIHSAGS